MSLIKVAVNARLLLDYLSQLQQRVGDMTPVLGEIGEYLIQSTKARFGTGTAPDGTLWAKNSPLTLEKSARIKNSGSFSSDDAVLRLFYLALENISKKWTMPIRDWKASLNRFTIQFGDKIPQH